MENGVGIVDGSHLGEKFTENNEVWELRDEKWAEVAGSDESKDSEGDQFFEEAVGSEIARVHSEDIVVNGDDDVEKVGRLGGGSLEFDDDSNVENEVEKFDEDIVVDRDGGVEKVAQMEGSLGFDSNVGNEVEEFEESVEVPIAVGNHEGELPISIEDKLEGVENGDPVDEAVEKEVIDEESFVEKVVRDELNQMEIDATAAGDGGTLKNLNLADEKSDVMSEKCENGNTNTLNLEGSLALENSENGCANKETKQVDKESPSGDAQIVLGGESDSQPVVGSNGEVLDQAGKCEEVKPTLGLSDSPDVESCLVNLENECDKNEKPKDMATVVLENQDERSPELKNTSVTKYLDQLGTSMKADDTLNTSFGATDKILEVEKLPASEDSVVKTDEKIQAGPANLEVKEVEDSQFLHGTKDAKASNGVAKGFENKGEQDEETKQSARGNREGDTKPEANGSASSTKPANSKPTLVRPAGLGHTAPLLEPAPRVVQQSRMNGTLSQMQNQLIEDPTKGETEENDETREKLQMIRVKFLRLAHRLGQTPHNVVVAQVLYRLGLAEQLRGRSGGRVNSFSFDRASAMAEQLEAVGQEPLDFSCTIMVIGKTGVGKSATINSIFDEVKFGTNAFHLGTKKVQDVVGTVEGIKVRVIDTPGLLPSPSDQRHNEKVLHSVKRFISKTPPDIVLYLDRLDMQSRDFGDMPLLRTITEIFGPSIWFNAIVVLTHAASAPPEGPNGTTTSYDVFVNQRSTFVQQAIRQAAGDMRLMNPVSLVENHSACRTNRAGQRVLPNGQIWKAHLLLLSFASKILAEANTLLKLQDSPPGKAFPTQTRAPPLPFLLSSLLQSRPQLKLPEEQLGDDDTFDDELDEISDSEDESPYDRLPFRRLTKAELGKLTKAQKKAYFEEIDKREELFMKKQLKEEKKRRKMMKKLAALAKDLPSDYNENVEDESSGAASVPVPMPDLALPASFDSDNPTHRFRHLDSSNQWVVRPVLDNHGWDHDIGYEGVNVEKLFVVKQAIPVSFSTQVTKDKKDANLQMEISSSVKHSKGKATSLGFDMQTLGKDMSYTLRSETRFINYRRNKATAGLSVTRLGDALTAGMKIEDQLIVNKRLHLVMSGGAMTGRGDVAYAGSLEATLRDKNHPFGRSLSTFGLSVMDWHGDLAIGGNLQSQIPIGRFTNLIARASLNNRNSGQVSIRLNSSEQLQIALIGLLPLVRKLLGHPQQLGFGQ
ncbi:hypothetical protein C3L33_19869, partial [Rhododendron williamsianum]